MVQEESFKTERRDLLDNKSGNRSRRIAQFTPFIGPHGLIRSSGRLQRLVEIDFDTKRPIVLDALHTFVKLFLRHTHLENHHQGMDYLRSKVQERFAFLKIRSSLHLINQTSSRVKSSVQQPFNRSSGLFYVTVRRTTEKGWGFLFTCLTSFAVHVEVVPSMDTSSCVMGVAHFVSRRSRPAMIWSDNSTNFVGAEKEPLDYIKKWNTNNITAEVAHKGIKWRFNPPSVPHQGGIWERLVRSFKTLLYSTLGTRRLTDEVLNTTFCLVECALNSGPLTPVSANPYELGAITPNHSLLDNRATGIPSIFGVDEFNHRKRYACAQFYANAIWVRLLKEYVPALNRRSKWQTPAEQLKGGDLVWIVEESNPRVNYPTARIEELRYGSDSVAYSTVVRTSSESLVRPLVKLVSICSQHLLSGRGMLPSN